MTDNMTREYELPSSSEHYRPVLDEFVRNVEDAATTDGLVLFGSSARGTATPESDLDILAVIQKNWPESVPEMNEAIRKVRESGAYKRLTEKGVVPQIYPFYIERDQLNEPPLIACEMVDHGIIIFDP